MHVVGLLLVCVVGVYGEQEFIFAIPENGVLGKYPEAVIYIHNPGPTEADVQVSLDRLRLRPSSSLYRKP